MSTAIQLSLFDLAKDINREHDACIGCAADAVTHAILAGEKLLEAKARVGHGKFGKWIEENCRFSPQTARRYMQVSKHKTLTHEHFEHPDSINGYLRMLADDREEPEEEEEEEQADEREQEEQNQQEQTTFSCNTCGAQFPEDVWHCPGCDRHWPFTESEVCNNCHLWCVLPDGTIERMEEQGTTEQDEDEPETQAPEPEPPFKLNGRPQAKSTFNVTNDMVDWARWTWNPVTGCEHNCIYCYARDIATIRFPNAFPKGFAPDFRPERLDAPRNTKLPAETMGIAWRNVFVCSMADLFGRWVPDEWIEAVFQSCRDNPEWNYLFLTKFPQRYTEVVFPSTSWVGTTVDEQKRVPNAEKAFRKIDVPLKWLSVEPMREPIHFRDLKMFDWVVIGGQSRSSQAPEFFPDPRWVHDLTDQAIKAGCKVYWKENIAPKKGMFKEYPDIFTT